MRFLGRLLPLLGLLAIPHIAAAFSINIDQSICAYVPCVGGGGATGAALFIKTRILPSLYIAFGGIAGLYLFFNAVKMVMYSNDEGAVGEARTGYYHMITGAIIVSLAALLVQTFAVGNGGAIVNEAPIASGVSIVILYFKGVLAIALTANIVIQAFRIITSQGESGQVDKARGRLIAGFIGVGFILLTNPILKSIIPGANSAVISTETAGIANFILTIVGFLCVVGVLVGGIMYVISVNESLKDKGKTAIWVSITALIVILTAFALVNTFLAVG